EMTNSHIGLCRAKDGSMRMPSHEQMETFDHRENAPVSKDHKIRRPRMVMVLLLSVVVIIGVGLVFLIRSWPFTRESVSQAIQETMHGTVQMRDFRSTFFPHPGCVVNDVTFRLNDQDPRPL